MLHVVVVVVMVMMVVMVMLVLLASVAQPSSNEHQLQNNSFRFLFFFFFCLFTVVVFVSIINSYFFLFVYYSMWFFKVLNVVVVSLFVFTIQHNTTQQNTTQHSTCISYSYCTWLMPWIVCGTPLKRHILCWLFIDGWLACQSVWANNTFYSHFFFLPSVFVGIILFSPAEFVHSFSQSVIHTHTRSNRFHLFFGVLCTDCLAMAYPRTKWLN